MAVADHTGPGNSAGVATLDMVDPEAPDAHVSGRKCCVGFASFLRSSSSSSCAWETHFTDDTRSLRTKKLSELVGCCCPLQSCSL